MNDWYNIENIDSLDSPALVVFPARVKANIQTAVDMAGNVNQLRPHVKTNKSAEATQLMLNAGITKFKCATIAEAEMLGMIKAPDVLLAYTPLEPNVYQTTGVFIVLPAIRAKALSIHEADQKIPLHEICVHYRYSVCSTRTNWSIC